MAVSKPDHIAFIGSHATDADPDLVNPECVAWMPIIRRQLEPVGAVQISDRFEVMRGEHMLFGRAGDYLIRCAGGEMFPVSAALFDVLFVRGEAARSG